MLVAEEGELRDVWAGPCCYFIHPTLLLGAWLCGEEKVSTSQKKWYSASLSPSRELAWTQHADPALPPCCPSLPIPQENGLLAVHVAEPYHMHVLLPCSNAALQEVEVRFIAEPVTQNALHCYYTYLAHWSWLTKSNTLCKLWSPKTAANQILAEIPRQSSHRTGKLGNQKLQAQLYCDNTGGKRIKIVPESLAELTLQKHQCTGAY